MKKTNSQSTYLVRKGNRIKEYIHAHIAKKLQSGDLSPDDLAHNRDGIWRSLKITQGFRRICSRIEERFEIPASQFTDCVSQGENNQENLYPILNKRLPNVLLEKTKSSGINSNSIIENKFKDNKNFKLLFFSSKNLIQSRKVQGLWTIFNNFCRYWSQTQRKKTLILFGSIIVMILSFTKIIWPNYSKVEDTNSEKRKERAAFYDKALKSSNKKMLLDLFKTKI